MRPYLRNKITKQSNKHHKTKQPGPEGPVPRCPERWNFYLLCFSFGKAKQKAAPFSGSLGLGYRVRGYSRAPSRAPRSRAGPREPDGAGPSGAAPRDSPEPGAVTHSPALRPPFPAAGCSLSPRPSFPSGVPVCVPKGHTKKDFRGSWPGVARLPSGRETL